MIRFISWILWSIFYFFLSCILLGMITQVIDPSLLEGTDKGLENKFNLTIAISMVLAFCACGVLAFFEKLPGTRIKKYCFFCIESIYKDATICRYCKKEIEIQSSQEEIIVINDK